jgi:hypothetical protein
MAFETDEEREINRLTKLWHGLIEKYEGKTVTCVTAATIESTTGGEIKKGIEYVVVKVHMYMGTTPALELEGQPKKLWGPAKFLIKDAKEGTDTDS